MGLLDWQCGDCRGLQWRLSFRFSCTNFSFILFSFLFLYSTQTISSFFLTFHAFTTIVFYAHANQKWIDLLGRKMIFLELGQTRQRSNKHRRYTNYQLFSCGFYLLYTLSVIHWLWGSQVRTFIDHRCILDRYIAVCGSSVSV